MRRRILISYILLSLFALTACSSSYNSPQKKISAYIDTMIEGDIKGATEFVNKDINSLSFDEMEHLESETMKYTLSKAKYKILEVEELKEKTNLSIEIENFCFLDVLDSVKRESITEKLSDEEAIALFKKNSKKAKVVSQQVMVSFIKEKGDWVFFGSNDMINSALLGFSLE